MNQTIADAIERSIDTDSIIHVTVEAEDIHSALEGALPDDFIQLDHGEWDVWGSDPEEWRLTVTIAPVE